MIALLAALTCLCVIRRRKTQPPLAPPAAALPGVGIPYQVPMPIGYGMPIGMNDGMGVEPWSISMHSRVRGSFHFMYLFVCLFV